MRLQSEQSKAELARQKAARRPTKRVRVNRALRNNVRAHRVQLPERRHSDSALEWKLVHKSKRGERKNRARAQEYKDGEELE